MSKNRVSTHLIEKYLDRHGWPKHAAIDESHERVGLVRTGWTSPLASDGHRLIIDPMVEKDMLQFSVRDIATAPTDATPNDRLSALLLVISAINYKLIMGGFAYDPSDGEIVFKLGIPIASDDFRFEDFERCLSVITVAVDLYADNLRGVIEGTKTAQDVLD